MYADNTDAPTMYHSFAGDPAVVQFERPPHVRTYSEPVKLSQQFTSEDISFLRDQLLREQELRQEKEEELDMLQHSLRDRYRHRVHRDTHDTDSGISNGFKQRSMRTNSLFEDEAGSRSFVNSMSLPRSSHPRSSTGRQPSFHSTPFSSTPHHGMHTSSSAHELYSPVALHRSELQSSWKGSQQRHVADKSVQELREALQDSENRRTVLMDKLREAQETLKIQTERLSKAESAMKENSFEVDDLKFKEKDYKYKIGELEKEKEKHKHLRMETFQQREQMKERLESLEIELQSLKTEHHLLLSDHHQRKDVLDKTSGALVLMEEENSQLAKSKDTMIKEMSALKESADIARSRNETLENEVHDQRQELGSLKEENYNLRAQVKSVTEQISNVKKSNEQLQEENTKLVESLQGLSEENKGLIQQLDNDQDVVADLKSKLTSTAVDKERYFQEKLDLHQKLQQLTYDKEHLYKTKLAAEEQLNELHAEIAQVKLQVDRKIEDNRKLEEEIEAVQKVSKDLSSQLSSTKAASEEAHEQVVAMEMAKKYAVQQQQLLQHENTALGKEMDALRKQMEGMMNEAVKDKEEVDKNNQKMRDDLKKAKFEKNQIENKCSELEAKLQRLNSELKESLMSQQQEMESWRSTCERLTASTSRKDAEIQMYIEKLQAMEEQSSMLKVDQHQRHAQYQDLLDAREEMQRLQEENRRLLQERAENQQVIQLLEMQKNILSKTTEPSLSKVYDGEQMKSKIDQIEAENKTLKNKVKDLESIRDELMKQIKGNAEESPLRKRKDELEKQNQQLRDVNNLVTEQLTNLEKENANMRKLMTDKENTIKSEKERLQREMSDLTSDYSSLKQQYEDLESRHHQVLSRSGTPASPRKETPPDISILQEEKNALENEVNMLHSQMVILENSKQRADDRAARLERQVQEATQSQDEAAAAQTRLEVMKQQIDKLKAELQQSKNIQSKQEALIKSLKERSLDDVGAELIQMRSELQKLLEVIQMKDQEIEHLEKQLKTARNQNAALRKEKSTSVAGEIDTGTAKIEDIGKQLKDAKQSTANRERIIEGLKKEIASMKVSSPTGPTAEEMEGNLSC